MRSSGTGRSRSPRVDAERRAGDRDALGVTGELEFRRRRPERLEYDVAVAENVDLAAGHAAMHPARHLQNFVGAEIQPVSTLRPRSITLK